MLTLIEDLIGLYEVGILLNKNLNMALFAVLDLATSGEEEQMQF